jgi:hypothetical protein
MQLRKQDANSRDKLLNQDVTDEGVYSAYVTKNVS